MFHAAIAPRVRGRACSGSRWMLRNGISVCLFVCEDADADYAQPIILTVVVEERAREIGIQSAPGVSR